MVLEIITFRGKNTREVSTNSLEGFRRNSPSVGSLLHVITALSPQLIFDKLIKY